MDKQNRPTTSLYDAISIGSTDVAGFVRVCFFIVWFDNSRGGGRGKEGGWLEGRWMFLLCGIFLLLLFFYDTASVPLMIYKKVAWNRWEYLRRRSWPRADCAKGLPWRYLCLVVFFLFFFECRPFAGFLLAGCEVERTRITTPDLSASTSDEIEYHPWWH